MENPYQPPSLAASFGDDSRHPLGVTILSVLMGILGALLLVIYIYLLVNWRENNEYWMNRRLAPSIFWLLSGTFIVMALAGSVGMWRGEKWGWWIGCFTLVHWLIQNLVGALVSNFSNGGPSFEVFISLESLKHIVRSMVVAIVLSYWMRTRVRRYFRVEGTSRIKAIVLVTIVGFVAVAAVTIVLQSIFLLWPRLD